MGVQLKFCIVLVIIYHINELDCKQNVDGAFTHVQYTEKLKQFGEHLDGRRNSLYKNVDKSFDKADEKKHSVYGQIQSEDGDKCSEQMDVFVQSVSAFKPWALKVVDMIGKEPSGMLDHPTLNWLGDYEQCVSTVSEPFELGNVTVEPFDYKYCVAAFDASSLDPTSKNPLYLNIGVCFPVSCNDSAVAVMSQQVVTNLQPPFKGLPIAYAYCHEDLKLDGKAKAVIAVCAIFAALMVLGTSYDILIQHFLNRSDEKDDAGDAFDKVEKSKYGSMANGTDHVTAVDNSEDRTPLLADLVESNSQDNSASQHKHDVGRIPNGIHLNEPNPAKEYKPGLLGRLLLAFSVYTNATKLLNTKQQAGTLTSVNGVRFISMTWVILGHTYVFGDAYTRNMDYLVVRLKRFTFQAIENETVAVDTFFVLSGLLVGYLTLKEIQRVNGPLKFNWLMFYFHRFWRLTPPYMLILMFYVPLVKYWGDGPMWSQTGVEKDECKDTWWRNLLYINNLYDTNNMCMGWSWYLANDMQFYVISPLILIPFYYSGIAGTVICFLLVLANFITTGAISKHNNISAVIKIDSPSEQGFDLIYVKPYTRIAPYAIGLLCGYILYQSNCKINVPKGKTRFNMSYRRFYQLLNILGWAIATTFAMLVLYGPYTSDGKYNMTEGESAFYNAANRGAWGLAIGWVVCACAMGYGGPVNKLLSWPAVIPASRLTYCAYLVHPVVMYVYNMSQRQLLYRYDLEIIYEFLGHLCMSYGVAFVFSMAFEAPMMGLEKVLLKRDKRS